MKLTIYTADCSGNEKNCLYPHRKIISSAGELAEATRMDHVFAEYRNNYRGTESFIASTVIPQDLDNEKSDDPADWETEESLSKKFSDVDHIIIPSRHNMLPKDGRTARPRMHVLFPSRAYKDAGEYVKIKKEVQKKYGIFDGNAVDAARLFYGTDVDPADIIWHEGGTTIDRLISPPPRAIPAGERNSTLSRFAGRIIKRYGESERAHDLFLEEASKCDPPLSERELSVIWKSAKGFGRKVAGEKGYIPPEEYEFENGSLMPSDFSDIGQAKVLAGEYGNELIYTSATGYLRYDGTRWDESKQKAVGAAEEFLDLQYEDAKDEYILAAKALTDSGIDPLLVSAGGRALEKVITSDLIPAYKKYIAANEYRKFVLKRRDMKYIASALQAAKPMLEKDYEDLDSAPYLLNCPDGTYDLRKGMAGKRDHSPSDLITKVTAASPSDEGKDLWLSSVRTTFQGDRELIDYVQMIAGIAMIGEVELEALIISYGEGSNGKSTFWNSVAEVLGSYSGTISADTLTVGCRRNVKPELAEAKGKRLLIAAELEEGMRLSTSVVKQLCSTDKISAEKKYKDPSSFDPTHMLVLYTNHLPRVGAMDSGIWRRLIVIPFTAKIEGKSDIKNYSKYLVRNAAPYILKWTIEGAEKAIERGCSIPAPACVRDAVKRYREESDWLTHFLEECCETGEDLSVPSGELYESYRAFCLRTGDFARSTSEFYSVMEQRGFERMRRKTGRYVLGLRLVDMTAFQA